MSDHRLLDAFDIPVAQADIMRRRSTIREVASRAGVSYQTVSRVINNSPDVAEATREHVLRVIAELDYHPNAQAVSLSRNRTDSVGIIVDTVTSTFFAQTIDGVAQALRRRGRFMLLATVEDATQFDVIDTLQRSRRAHRWVDHRAAAGEQPESEPPDVEPCSDRACRSPVRHGRLRHHGG